MNGNYTIWTIVGVLILIVLIVWLVTHLDGGAANFIDPFDFFG